MPVITDIPVTVNIGPWMRFTKELFEFLKTENAAMANMTFAEAAIAMGYKFVSGVGWVKNISITTEVVSSAGTAAEAIAGTVATGAAETTTGTIVLTETASGGAAAMGLGTVATATAALILAGASGYIIGNITGELIDNAFPEFFDGLFCSLSEFLTGDERGLAFLFDGDGHAYLPEASQLAVKKYLDTSYNKFLNATEHVTIDDVTLKYKQISVGDRFYTSLYPAGKKSLLRAVASLESSEPVYGLIYGPVTALTNGDNSYSTDVVFFSKTKFTLGYIDYENVLNASGSWTCPENPIIKNLGCFSSKVDPTDGTYYWCVATTGCYGNDAHANSLTVPINNTSKDFDTARFIKKILFAESSSGSSSTIPEMQTYEVPAKPKIKTHPQTQSDSETEPETWIRIPLPEPSSDPETLPETTPKLEPEDKPETEKLPKPLPQPEPQGTATPSPDIDPSTEPEPVTPVPPTPTPTPEDSGSTPKPPTPVIPPISPASGLLHVYNPTAEQVNEFGAWLWTTFSGDLIDTIAKLFNNPMDAVIGLHELYCTPITGSSTTIKAGFLDSNVTSRLVTQRYTEINCGAITVPEYWGNYLDYAPYTKVYCYLPFIGIVELNTDDIIGHGVQVVYKIDTYNGSCIAMIITAKNKDQECVKYQFSGNCAVELPITSGMKSTMQSALIGAATCAIGVAGAGAIAGKAVTSASLKAAAGKGLAQGGLNGKDSVSHSGSFGSSYGAMGIKKPYFIVRRPIQKVVENYNKKYGYPAHSMVNIGSCSGFLRCRDFDVQSSTATEEEKRRIEILLKEGVYV